MTAVRTAQRTSARTAATAPIRPTGGRRSGSPRLTIATAPRRRGGNRLVVMAAAAVLMLAVIAISVSQALQVQAHDRRDDLQGQIVLQQQLAQAQRLELAELQSPVRIVDKATGQLGMIPPGEVVYLRSDPADDDLIATPNEALDEPSGADG
jgi:cell division protein FtsL